MRGEEITISLYSQLLIHRSYIQVFNLVDLQNIKTLQNKVFKLITSSQEREPTLYRSNPLVA